MPRLGACLVLCWSLAATAGEVAIGVFAFQGERAANADWTPVIRYLNQAIPGQQFRLENHDAQSLRAAIADQRQKGEHVVQQLPGDNTTAAALGCERMLVQQDGQWTVKNS